MQGVVRVLLERCARMRQCAARVQAAVPEKPAVTRADPLPQPTDERWVTRDVLLVLGTQILFGLGW